jgi:hypothetical protein
MDRVRRAAAELGDSLTEPWVTGLRLSLGYASTAEGTPVEQLLALADRRMYADKPRGTRGYSAT